MKAIAQEVLGVMYSFVLFHTIVYCKLSNVQDTLAVLCACDKPMRSRHKKITNVYET